MSLNHSGLSPSRPVYDRPAWLIDDLDRIEALLLESAGASDSSLVGESSTHLLKAGGKRLRPALVMICSRAGEPTIPATDLAAAAVELVHLATLYHDDIIDETETRRGAPTAHSKWGTEIAVLAGDYLFARACELGADAGGEVPKILSRALASVCEGQITEIEGAGRTRTVDEYLETVKRKTASLFHAACELGASTSGVEGRARDDLMDYGLNLGIGFQIVDDLLDLVGDEDVTGKRPGTDLREGIFTLPVLRGLEREPSLAEKIAQDAGLEEVLASLEATNALADATAEARGYLDRAVENLDDFPDSEWKSALESLATEAGAAL